MGGLDSTDVSVIGLLVLVHLGVGFRYTRPVTRASEREKWARRHRAHVPSGWVVPVDRQLRSHRRFAAVNSCCFILIMYLVPTPFSRSWVAGVAVVPGLLVLARGLVIAPAAAALPSGSRVARAREVTVADYLSPRARIVSWTTVGLAVGVIGYTAIRTSSTVLLVPMASVIAAGALIEAAGVRFARMPEPAEDAIQLYLQDAFRADALRGAWAMTGVSALLVVLAVPDAFDLPAEQAIGYLEFVAIVGACLGLVAFFPDRPVARMRARLWPTLGPDQLVMPDDADLSRGVTL
ncbi:hypothetical protein [Nocardioides cynanchi]|uniref:hypothetical protein n=1 Tax=Nocardioides cynanchi TaxID=2558918 RepID=UPI0012451375|nr:hypothetical protein [Nocardioides cynanchi]